MAGGTIEDAHEAVVKLLNAAGRGDIARRFKEVEVWEIEVPNAPLYAEVFGIKARHFCSTYRNPCDIGPEELLLDRLARLTGVNPYECEHGSGGNLCRLYKMVETLVYKYPYNIIEEVLARLDAAAKGDKYAIILTENNEMWDLYTTASPGDKTLEAADRLAEFMEKLDRIKEKLAEAEDWDEYDRIEELSYENPEKLFKIIEEMEKHGKLKTRP